MRELGIGGAWLLEPKLFGDPRGHFLEWYSEGPFSAAVGRPLRLAQANCSVSCRGAVRGIHFADVPPGQAKHVTCVRGSVLDVVVDLRVGSPTFGRWEAVPLDDKTHHAVYLSEGLGHAFMALTDDATVVYLCSEPYAPNREHGVHPLDPELAIDWPLGIEPLLSDKDASAPSLREAQISGLLPAFDDCQDLYALLGGDR